MKTKTSRMRRLVKTAVTVALAGVALGGTASAANASVDDWRKVGHTWNGRAVWANQNTSTNFAGHAGMAAQHGRRTIRVYSNATRRFVTMRCYGGTSSVPFRPRICRGGNNAAIRLTS
jgi:hypothetical protein